MIVEYILVRRNIKLPLRDTKGRFKAALPKPAAIEKNPFATFFYPSSDSGYDRFREVRVISSTESYLTGLELNRRSDKWQYKKYCQHKIQNLRISFNEGAMK
jgi:hypothetical protein